MSDEHQVEALIELDIYVTEDNSVLVKLSGFESADDADKYAEYLNRNLSLMLFETKVIH